MYKIIFLTSFLLLGLIKGRSQEEGLPEKRKQAIIQVMKQYTDMGLPGLAVSIYTPDTGLWTHAEGYANMENRDPLSGTHLHYLQSVSKTYMATAILMLHERGKLSLDDSVLKYVREPWLTEMEGSGDITVRMLLNHTSGLPEYSTHPGLVSRIIQNPLSVLTVGEMLSFLGGESLENPPGKEYVYRNTNYALLSLLADTITGDHVAFVNSEILEKSGLQETIYLTADNYDSPLNLVDSYWDVLMEGRPANVSGLQRANVASMKGDDGLVASVADAVLFLRALMEGRLLKPATLEQMQNWVTDKNGKPRYGLGLTYYDLDSTYGIGHSGGGIGAGCVLLYLPDLRSCVFIATNFNTMMESPIRKRAENIQADLLTAIFAE